MMVLRRIALPLINSFVITAALFGVMYSLIYMKEPELVSRPFLPAVVFTKVPEDTPPRTIVPRAKAPIEVELPPEYLRDDNILEIESVGDVPWASYEVTAFERGNAVPMDNQLVIAIGFPPEYPSGALRRGIEGWAVVGFSVSASGAVYEPYILESQPVGVFDRASLKAISRFKYKARHVDGRPVNTDGQRYMFTFKIDE